MSGSKHFDKIAWSIIALTLVITLLFMNGQSLGLQIAAKEIGYESRLFDTERVHTVDIVMDNWNSFLETCENEEYAAASVIIDGESYKSVGIRAKGNTSLSSVRSMNSDRYSFKIEFDHYDSTKSYHGLDKLCLNNIIQDNTYVKDYLTYQMMNKMGVSAPLCSFVYITVNGEDWGLYLAVEGVEDSFLSRNYGSNYGDLYKPDSLSFGGGRGNGRDFDMNDFMTEESSDNQTTAALSENTESPSVSNRPSAGQMPNNGNFDPSTMFGEGSFEPSAIPNNGNLDPSTIPDIGNFDPTAIFGEGGFSKGNSFGGMGSSDVKLQYIDDDPESYANIFGSAKTVVTDEDQARLISSLQALTEGVDIASAVDVEAVIRYFVVHNFVCNFDSYTGSMIHNYYLYEKDGLLSMIPWDYNLAFGSFMSSGDATSTVNYPIDTPVSGGSMDDRPMIAWIFADQAYTEAYHTVFGEFVSEIFESGYFTEWFDKTVKMIAPYVEKDPTKFCSFEQFEAGTATLREFCLRRAESVRAQLDGTIPSTSEGQRTEGVTLVSGSDLTISDMGTMSMGGGRSSGGDMMRPTATDSTTAQIPSSDTTGGMTFEEIPATGIQRPSDNRPMGNGAATGENGMTDRLEGNFPNSSSQGAANATNNSNLLWLGISLLTLVVGLVIAKLYRR